MIINWIKPKLLYLALLSFGINLCFGFQLANLSSLFKFLGAGNSDLPLLWLIPPLTGLIIQPLIGQISDDTCTRFGKRRPYILGWGIIASLAFSFLPLAGTLMTALFFTWLIDCSLNGGAEGLRALTGDLTRTESERSKAFALQAFFAGIGGALGTSLPFLSNHLFQFLHFKQSLILGQIPLTLKFSFLLAGGILAISLFYGIRNIQERNFTHASLLFKKKKAVNLSQRLQKTFHDLFFSIRNMPKHFRKICFMHSLTWVGIFIFWLYFTVAIAQNVYGLPLHTNGLSNSEYAKILQKASLDSSLYFMIYQYVSVLYAIFLYFLAKSPNVKLMHAGALLLGAIGITTINFTHQPLFLILAFVAIGIMWGSVTIFPYAIAMQVLPKGKMGTYLGIFNISITAPQILCGLLLTPIYTHFFQGNAGYILLFASGMIILSAWGWLKLEKASHRQSLLMGSPVLAKE